MCYLEKHVPCFSNDTPEVKVAYSLACIIRSILFSEYYKCNGSPNTLYIIDKLRNEIAILKDIGSFYNNWINRSLSSADFLLLKMNVPKNPTFMHTIEQRAIDLLQDNNSSKSFYSHSKFDGNIIFLAPECS